MGGGGGGGGGGGNLPHSPVVMMLFVVALTRRIHRMYRKNILSASPQSFDLIPQTSLPYIRIGFISASDRFNIILGGNYPIDLTLRLMLNTAFIA